jgi:hypothetical protein
MNSPIDGNDLPSLNEIGEVNRTNMINAEENTPSLKQLN